ncbi:hypothetical protein ACLB1Q_36225 [Escherichia coli]
MKGKRSSAEVKAATLKLEGQAISEVKGTMFDASGICNNADKRRNSEYWIKDFI